MFIIGLVCGFCIGFIVANISAGWSEEDDEDD